MSSHGRVAALLLRPIAAVLLAVLVLVGSLVRGAACLVYVVLWLGIFAGVSFSLLFLVVNPPHAVKPMLFVLMLLTLRVALNFISQSLRNGLKSLASPRDVSFFDVPEPIVLRKM